MTTQIEDQPYDEIRDEDQHFEWLSLSEVLDDPENLREEYDGIEELAQSIKAQGLKQPIVVRRDSEGKYIILAGHRRKRALILAGQLRTRVIVDHKEYLPEDVLATMLIENSQRKDLNPMEQAFGLAKIKEQKGLSDAEVGALVGRSQVWVTDRVRLLGLTPDEQQAVREGRMTLSEGKRVGRLNTGAHRPGAVGKKGAGFFTSSHELGQLAAKRCKALGHKAGGPNYVAIACGKCWEHVIRADERSKNQQQAIANGNCGICGQAVEQEPKGTEDE